MVSRLLVSGVAKADGNLSEAATFCLLAYSSILPRD